MLYRPRFTSLVTVLSFTLLTACATSQQSKQQIKIADDALGYEEPEWGKPFWERGASQEKEEPARQVNSSSVKATPRSDELRTNLAIVGASGSFYRALDNLAADYGFRLIPRSELAGALTSTPACADTVSEACAEALATYPGARMVVTIEDDSSVTITDAASNARWGTTELTSGKQSEELLELVSQRADIAPWVMKAFRADDGRLYLSAGRANGLETGDELAIHEPGTLVRAPNGQPITWRAGERVGTLRIDELLGSDLSSLIPIEGQRPTPQHDLILITH